MGRFFVLLVFVWLACGCAGGGLIAFPPTGGDDPQPRPAQTETSDETVPNIVWTPLVAHATRQQVWQVSCALRPALVIGGNRHPLDLHVDGRACAAVSADGISANVDGNRGIVELQVPQGTTPEEARELKQGLDDVSRELARRLSTAPPAPVVPDVYTPLPVKAKKKSAGWFLVAGILGGIGLGMVIIGGGLASSSDHGVQAVGNTFLASVALPCGIGAAITGTVALILLASE